MGDSIDERDRDRNCEYTPLDERLLLRLPGVLLPDRDLELSVLLRSGVSEDIFRRFGNGTDSAFAIGAASFRLCRCVVIVFAAITYI